MVFSFFKKDPKDKQPPAKGGGKGATVAGTPQRSSQGPSTVTAKAERERARSQQVETAAKIDQIESEMNRVLGGDPTTTPPVEPPSASAPATAPGPALPRHAPGARVPHDPYDNEDGWAGGTNVNQYTGVDAIEIQTLSSGSVIEEAAILFANGQPEAAEVALRVGTQADDLGSDRPVVYRMLLEIINQRGDRAAFTDCAVEFASRCRDTPPAWFDYSREGEVRPAATAPAVTLPAVLDAGIVKALEQLKSLTARHAVLVLDLSATRQVDLVGAQLLLRVVNAFKRASHELTFVGIDKLEDALRAAISPGRRDASDALWMLLFEVLRMRERPQAFEELGIQYCITFEVSPPSWEPAPRNLSGRATAGAAGPGGGIEWRGALDTDADRVFAKLVERARLARRLTVDCRQLRRIAFGAASALLAHLGNLRDEGISIEFHDVNPVVGALFDLLGISEVAGVKPRHG